MRGLVTLRAATIAAALAFVPSLALAQNNAALAEQRFSEGLAALKGERWAAACEAFAASNAAEASAGTLINLGVCNEKQKKFASAYAFYDAAYRLATDPGKERPDKAKVAKAEMDRIAPSVHKLHVVMARPLEGATLYRNGELLGSATLAGDDLSIDPGKYTFELRAKGKKSISKEIAIPETAGKTSLEFPAMEDAPADQPGNAGAAVGDGTIGGPIVVADGSSQRTVGIIVGGAGILALLAAGGVQLLAISEDKKAEDLRADASRASSVENRDQINQAAKSRQDAAENNQLIAIIVGAGGVVLLGVGAVLFFTAPSHKSSGKPQVLPVVGPGYAGASLGLSF